MVSELAGEVLKGKLKTSEFPFVDSAPSYQVPSKIIIFIIGGVTFSEARFIQNLNQSNPKVNIILGGSSILNSKDFYFKYL